MILFRLLIATLVAAASMTIAAQDLDAARVAYEREDYDTAFKLYSPAANKANAEAQYRLGLMYKFGWGTERDAQSRRRTGCGAPPISSMPKRRLNWAFSTNWAAV